MDTNETCKRVGPNGKVYEYAPGYNVWANMKSRCSNEYAVGYERYGGRGITVCDEWLSFDGFKAWCDASGYRKGLTLERIDNSLGYGPGNCRWATMKEQMRNTHRAIYISAFGERMHIKDWIEKHNPPVGYQTIRMRIERGWSHEDAVTIPPGSRATYTKK